MKKVSVISPHSQMPIKKTRACAYCRVSSNSADQLNSYATQIRVYTKEINNREDWELVEIFADEGISGTASENRTEFLRMIKLCELGKIDMIITKSVSRFARNVKEALEYVRKLKALGVGVIFEKEGINTKSLGDEMLLSTFSALAEEESVAISQNLRFSITKRMENGTFVDSNAPYGFRLVNKQLVEYTPEADIVREIFRRYLDGESTTEIARGLIASNIPTKMGKERWTSHRVAYILSNEKYVGDSLYQKTARSQTVPFKQTKNRGQEDSFYATETHIGIMDRETFDAVQALRKIRKEKFGTLTELNTYPLSHRIRCTECGAIFRRRVRNGGVIWGCGKHIEDKHNCDSHYYTEAQIYDRFLGIVNKLRFSESRILEEAKNLLGVALNNQKRNNTQAREVSQSLAELNAKMLMLEQLRSKGYLAPEVYQAQAKDITNQMAELKAQRTEMLVSKIEEVMNELTKFQEKLDEIEEPLEQFDEVLFEEIVKEIHINRLDEITFIFAGGVKITEAL